MLEKARNQSVLRTALIIASFVIIVLGMKYAEPILSPIIFAIFIAILCMPLLRWLQRRGIPTWLALVCMILGLVILGVLLTGFMYLSLRQLDDKLPFYQQRLDVLYDQGVAWLTQLGVDPALLSNSSPLSPSSLVSFASGIVNGIVNGAATSFLILLGIIFTMLEAPYIQPKLTRGLGPNNSVPRAFAEFSRDLQQFVYLKAINNLIVAVGALILLFVFRIDFALFWGVLIFFLSFIPNVGIVVACIPIIALALIQHGVLAAVSIGVGITVINLAGDNIITPRLMSEGLDLSQFSVFFSFIFWAWVLGASGALLSVPLTLLLKLFLEANEDTRWLGILLGSHKNREPGPPHSAKPEPLPNPSNPEEVNVEPGV